ncbi:hypothetical protein M3Y98_00226500 [Aphelenchoides besseyi]|nr:hypothetical protein M3Y98_00226500 [Aphelenchoides besseyi]
MDAKRTALVFNSNHDLHFNSVLLDHPEHPKRIVEIRKRLKDFGLLEKCRLIEENIPELSEELLSQTHGHEYVKELKSLQQKEQSEINEFASRFDSVSCTKDSYNVAISAASCAVHLTQQVVRDNLTNGFALIRPPGHHAQRSIANGFCLLNNVALAARSALTEGLEKILIVDFDVHHGQGVQMQFYNDPRVMYFSVHRYEHGSFWPNLPEGDFDSIGDGMGTQIEDADYMFIFWNILHPIAVEFEPQIILFSAGFDACAGDPVGHLLLTPHLFANWVFHLRLVCQRQVLILEGGGVPPELSCKKVRKSDDTVPKKERSVLANVSVPTGNVLQDQLLNPFDCDVYDRPLPNPTA